MSRLLVLLLLIASSLSSNASPRLIYSSASTAQIRIPAFTQELSSISIPVNPPITITQAPPPVSVSKPSVDILNLNLSIIPASDRGILYDTSRPIDRSNPIRIINSAQGGYSSLFVQDDQYFNISIGSIPTTLNELKPNPSEKIDLKNLEFLSGAVLQSSAQPIDLKLANLNITESYSLGVTAHGRLRYTTVDQDFRINGFLVPAGFIIVARRKPEMEHKGYPELEDFEDFRVYDPSNSALIKTFDYNSLRSSKCAQGQCFNLNKFATPKETWQFGAKVFSNFSTRDLFNNQSAWQANKLWISMQSNLEAQTILRINSKSETWAKRVLEDLNEDEFNYINHINNFELSKTTDSKQRLAIIKNYFGFTDIAYPDQKAQELHEKIFEDLWNLAISKTRKWQNPNPSLDQNLTKEIIQKREVFISSLSNYEDYLKNYKSPVKTPAVEIASNPQLAPNSPAKAPSPAPKPPKKQKPNLTMLVCKKTGFLC
jgi:hypothetical protein